MIPLHPSTLLATLAETGTRRPHQIRVGPSSSARVGYWVPGAGCPLSVAWHGGGWGEGKYLTLNYC
jgi:hypothetical protein